MTQSHFIASLIGPVFLAVSGSMLLNRTTFQSMLRNLEDNLLLIMFAGIALLVTGIAIVLTHNIWHGWPFLITLFGWIAIIGGLIRILFAPRMTDVAQKFADNDTLLNVAIAITLLIGLFFTGKGFALF